jgi:hypothetical protein
MLRSPACSFFSGGDCFLGFFSFFSLLGKGKVGGEGDLGSGSHNGKKAHHGSLSGLGPWK